MDPPPLAPGTARWSVLATLATHQQHWTAAQVAVDTGLALERVISALGWLRQQGFVEIAMWARMDTLHHITDTGRARLAQGGQIALELT